jgi:hypothetical protein
MKAALGPRPGSPAKRGGGGAVLGPGHFTGPGYAAALKPAAAAAAPGAGDAGAGAGDA